MRILLVNKYWKPVGGVEEHCGYLIELLEKRGHEVLRFGMDDPDNVPPLPTRQTVGPVSFHAQGLSGRARAAGRATLGLETRRKISSLIESESIDVAHIVHAYHQLGMTFLPILRRAGIPTLLDLHDYKIVCPRYLLFSDSSGEICTTCLDHRSGWLWAPMARRCWGDSALSGAVLTMEAASARIVKAYKGASLVVVRNELQREAAINVGVDEDRVRVIPNWVSGKHLAGANRQESFLFVGRLVREKGVDVLIEAAASAGVRVKIIGDGPVRGELEAQVRERSAPVEMLGWLPHDQVVDSLAKSAGLIVPSVWPEVFPLVICEAFATGTAVVGTAVGGVEDLLSEGRGFLCQPGDVNGLAEILRRISAQPEEAAERAREARRFASDMLSHEAWVNHYESAYEAIGASL